jgi:hypothetical protein
MTWFTSTNTATVAAILALGGVVWVCGTAGLPNGIDEIGTSSISVNSTIQNETVSTVAVTEKSSETIRVVSNDSDSKNRPSAQRQVTAKPADRNKPAVQVRTGTIRGRIVFDGTPPEHELMIEGLPKVDPAVCGQIEHYYESMLVNPLNNGIRNVFVYIVRRKEFQPASAPPQTPVKVRFIGCRVEPRCIVIQPRQELQFHNDDRIRHYPETGITASYNQPWFPPGDEVGRGSFKNPEALPFRYSCVIHPWIRGWILVCDHPFAAITDSDGNFVIDGVPHGEHMLRVFHERGGLLNRSLKIVVNSNEVALPELSFDASRFGD